MKKNVNYNIHIIQKQMNIIFLKEMKLYQHMKDYIV